MSKTKTKKKGQPVKKNNPKTKKQSKTIEDKENTVIKENTYVYFDNDFEKRYQKRIEEINKILIDLQNEVKNDGKLKEKHLKELLMKEKGLRALLALSGFSNEYFKRVITLARVVNNENLSALLNQDKWQIDDGNTKKFSEWSDDKIQDLITNNENFRKGIVNLFWRGSSNPYLKSKLPLFELKKLNLRKFEFEIPLVIDTLVRYKEKGSYAGTKDNNAESAIEKILNELNVEFQKGDLPKLKGSTIRRKMDFIILNEKNEPVIIIECSFLVATGSGQGDKATTEIAVGEKIKSHYKNPDFIGFVDGIGWFVRQGDLKKMVEAYDDVFTLHTNELNRFKKYLENKRERGIIPKPTQKKVKQPAQKGKQPAQK
jgi:hypothetical protein